MKMREKELKKQNIQALKYNKTNIRLIIGISLLAMIVLLVVFSLLVEIYDPNEVNYSYMLKKPSLKHFFTAPSMMFRKSLSVNVITLLSILKLL